MMMGRGVIDLEPAPASEAFKLCSESLALATDSESGSLKFKLTST